MHMVKNSIGQHGKRIEVDVVSWMDREPASPCFKKQRTRFQWHEATTELILGTNNYEFDKKASVLKDMQEVTGIRDATRGKCFSKVLGVSQDDPVTYGEMGALLERAPREVMEELHLILGIHEHRIFKPDERFCTQLKDAQREADVTQPVGEQNADDSQVPSGVG